MYLLPPITFNAEIATQKQPLSMDRCTYNLLPLASQPSVPLTLVACLHSVYLLCLAMSHRNAFNTCSPSLRPPDPGWLAQVYLLCIQA